MHKARIGLPDFSQRTQNNMNQSPFEEIVSYWLGKPTVGNLGLIIFGGPGLGKWIVEWHFSIISQGPLSLTSTVSFEGALLLNELSYRPGIGLILKS